MKTVFVVDASPLARHLAIPLLDRQAGDVRPVDGHVGPDPGQRSVGTSRRLPGFEEPYVPDRVLALVGSNVDLACALLRRFVDDLLREWFAIEDAVSAGEPSAVARSVNALDGSLALVASAHSTGRVTAWARNATGGVASVSPAELFAGRDELAVLLERMCDYLRRTDAAAPGRWRDMRRRDRDILRRFGA